MEFLKHYHYHQRIDLIHMKERYLVLLLFLMPALFWMGFRSVTLTGFSASVSEFNNSEIVVKWSVNTLDDVRSFQVYRRMHNSNDFIRISEADRDIAMSERENPPAEFEFIDRNVYKQNTSDDLVYYRLRIIQRNGSHIDSQPVHVQYTTSAVRRTWGSIKSMFQ